MVTQRLVLVKTGIQPREQLKKGAIGSPDIVVGCDPTDQICTRTVQLFEPSPLQTCCQNELLSYFEV